MEYQKVWDDVFESSEWGKYPSVDLVRFVARNYYKVENRKQTSFLEIGCGPGPNLWFLAREGFKVYGLEGSEVAVERCRNRLNSEVPNWQGRIDQGDFTATFNYESNSIDSVIDCEAVYCTNFESAVKVYQECNRVLKKGGKLEV